MKLSFTLQAKQDLEIIADHIHANASNSALRVRGTRTSTFRQVIIGKRA
jgi:plasmid stabilization system protein ParE